LKVLKFLNEQHKVTDGNKWIQTWVYPGFETLERLLQTSKGSGKVNLFDYLKSFFILKK